MIPKEQFRSIDLKNPYIFTLAIPNISCDCHYFCGTSEEKQLLYVKKIWLPIAFFPNDDHVDK